MAAVGTPSPGLYGAVLQTLQAADPWSQPLSSAMAGLVDHLSAEEAECLPEAFAGLLPLLRRDPERLRFAAEIAGRLDFFEAAGVICDLAIGLPDRRLLLEAASLCGNPAADPSVRARVLDALQDDPVGRIRIDPTSVPASAEERRLYRQCWPGGPVQDDAHVVTPTVVLDKSADAAALMRLAVRLDESGSSLRRLDPGSDVAPWFGPHTVLVGGPTARTRVLSKYSGFSEYQIIVADPPTDDRGMTAMLRRISAALPSTHKLRSDAPSSGVQQVVWDPGVLTSGVYTTKEAAFLGGTTTSSLNYLRKRELLTPRRSNRFRWTFRDVVALRTWTYLKAISPRRVSSRVVTSLARFGGDVDAARLGVTSEGSVLVDRGTGWVDVETGASPLDFDISDVDDVFRPFDYGGGHVLDLLQASTNTRLHPTVLSGAPHLEGHRISAKALASVDRLGRREVIEAFYPELAGKYFEDTVTVGVRLLNVV